MAQPARARLRSRVLCSVSETASAETGWYTSIHMALCTDQGRYVNAGNRCIFRSTHALITSLWRLDFDLVIAPTQKLNDPCEATSCLWPFIGVKAGHGEMIVWVLPA